MRLRRSRCDGDEFAQTTPQPVGRRTDLQAPVSLQRAVGNRGAARLLRGVNGHHNAVPSPAVQRYMTYQLGGGAGQYGQSAANTFSSQVTAPGAPGFLDPALAGNQPRINNAPAPALRISQNGHLAIEDADLNNRQPKHFYAEPARVAEWNDKLIVSGSYVRLLSDPAMFLTFTLPNGAARHLVRVFARNVVRGNQGNTMTIAQQCDSTIKEVMGTHHGPETSFLNAPGIALPAVHNTLHEEMRQYYIAAELAAAGGVGGPTGGMPAAGLSLANPAALSGEETAIGGHYGNAMHAHMNGAPNPALDARMQQLGVNQYAAPSVGEGLVTHSLGDDQQVAPALGAGPAANIRADPYNNRNIMNPSNQNMWRYHWGGVVAADGGDYLTLENYARNEEDAVGVVQNPGSDLRFYFQMYGPGAQSWHAAWSAIGGGGREFSNPLTMKLVADQNPNANQGFDTKADRAFGATVDAVKDHHGTVAGAGTTSALMVALLKGLAYGNAHINGGGRFDRFGRWNRIDAWSAAANAASANANATPQTNALAAYLAQRLGAMVRNPARR